MRQMLLLLVVLFVLESAARAAEVDFVRDVQPIFEKHCYACHGSSKQRSGLRLDVKSAALKGGDGYGASIVAGDASGSPLIELITSADSGSRMPPEAEPLDAKEIQTLTEWIEQGAVWPDGVDRVKLEDRLDHWSFKPLRTPELPSIEARPWARNEVDHFILARLERENLDPSPPADAITWLRRVTLDLTGLPPTPHEVEAFVREANNGEAAYVAVVDRLLQSPRYGERWAQHWLDVVRYADTHGFEVNTERPNAWPYRDYVIQALNDDVPYDRFISEQIAGDAMGADVATGFLVTASVLLPGQIGKDAASIRLARQDSLDEIVNNIGQTFLGLSVGCARCHDHKFDPISAKDYYSMQAFVAGVEYADREIDSPQANKLRHVATSLRQRLTKLDKDLAQLVPLAHPMRDRHSAHQETNAKENTVSFAPLEAKFVRLTIHDCNLHPSLGLIEPCVDEFEIFTDETEPQNIALSSLGTLVTASGSRVSASHQLNHINDGQYGNASSWMADTNGSGWVMFQLPSVQRIAKIVWSRDRTGRYSDRLPIAYTLEAGRSIDDFTTLVDVPARRDPVRASVNVDRFPPVRAKRLRFSVLATNRLEPCIDELEVYDVAGRNVALASLGTIVTTSGDTVVANRHEPRFLNDGRYGNSRSWMSSTTGSGWVEFEFPTEHEIDRVVWGRDREEKFKDRLATEYRIEVVGSRGSTTVADSTDRRPWMDSQPKRAFSVSGLTVEETRLANRWLKEKQSLQTQIKAAEDGQRAFAGAFRTPDAIHLLRRGDPEQPAEPVTPAVLSAIGDLMLPNTTPEQERRIALADWITHPSNPLPARVIVNRIWQWHFGIGLVETANDFGRNGVAPSHPELLDWLAQRFIRSDWSIKQMHRLIVLSSTYRQSNQHNAEAAAVDADARLLWRYPSRRLEAEAIRDCMLAVSGRLNPTMGGRGFDLFNQRGGLAGFTPIESFTEEGLRRMVYAHKVRRERDAVFGAFDCPDAGQSTARRIESTTPIQALNLFNSRVTIDQSSAFSARVRQEVGDDVKKQIRRAYELALNRTPTEEETDDAEPIVLNHGLSTLCRVLFNSNEFLFLP